MVRHSRIRRRDSNEGEKRGISPLLAVIFFLSLTVVVVVEYETFLNSMVVNEYVEVEKNTKDGILIQNLIGTEVYVKNNLGKDVFIEVLKVAKKDCNVEEFLNPGMNIINIGNCHDGLSKTTQEVVLYTKEGVYSSYEFLDAVPKFAEGAIGNCEELLGIYDDLGGKYYLTKNLYCFESKAWNNGDGFAPIGSLGEPFTGLLDGGGYSIRGITINSNENYNGFFGSLQDAEVVNLNLEDINVKGGRYTGGLSAYAKNTIISGVHITGNIAGDERYIGGIVAFLEDSSILESSYNEGLVLSNEKYAGGLVGLQNNSIIRNSYSTGDVISNESYAGGAVGYQIDSVLENSYSTGYVDSREEDSVGGLVGYSFNSVVTSSYWDVQTSNQLISAAGEGKLTSEMRIGAIFVGWDFASIWSINEGVDYPKLR